MLSYPPTHTHTHTPSLLLVSSTMVKAEVPLMVARCFSQRSLLPLKFTQSQLCLRSTVSVFSNKSRKCKKIAKWTVLVLILDFNCNYQQCCSCNHSANSLYLKLRITSQRLTFLPLGCSYSNYSLNNRS